jgi:hypothetical protein
MRSSTWLAALWLVAAASITALTVSAEAQSSSATAASTRFAAPRTPWGDPDLQGSYNNSNESGIPMARPAEFAGRRLQDVKPDELARLAAARAKSTVARAATIGGTTDNDTGAGPSHWYENYNARNSRAWMVLDPEGVVPTTTEEAARRAAALRAARRGGDGYYTGPFDGPEDFTLYVRCITRGVPGSMMPAIYGNSYDITQGPGFVAIRYEMVHETRVIPLDGRSHVPSSMASYMGDARGRWDGDTLVVETVNYLEKSAYSGASRHLKTVERFKPVAAGIDWSITLDDSHTWTKPWSFGMLLTRDDTQPIVEYACHEGNEGMRGMLKAARKEDQGK